MTRESQATVQDDVPLMRSHRDFPNPRLTTVRGAGVSLNVLGHVYPLLVELSATPMSGGAVNQPFASTF